MAYNEETIEFEAKIIYQSEKSWLVEMTVPINGNYKFFLPKSKKVTYDHNESDADGNWIFKVSGWWWQKIHAGDFVAHE